MKRPQLCICGRAKAEHYHVTIRRRRRKLRGCEKFRPAPANPAQLNLSLPKADHPQEPRQSELFIERP